jgi:23S rRNA (pseudouridine1915-N3)-methyltransferase
MKLALMAFGKLKTPGLQDSAEYYRKLLRSWIPVQEIEMKPLQVPDKAPATRARIQEKEADTLNEKLEGFLTGRGVFYLLDEGGKARSTQEWAELVREWEAGSIPEVAICVGSSLGFSKELRKKARGILSLGPQTLPHELARVVLLEQLYRAWGVTRGHPYHVEG